ncbi:class E sortase [Streptomyces kunmingensis]|uniref:Class E sortase n=1 Tax=Streptomyces kunmingensis TaxID=68225 RepID=A0ABU6CMH6_9ACTN|nr:class E sortase [Streptomyces kunmingensis]MEB3965898.1 class E sortase [Streptomyces kunmingensis]
MTALRPEPGGAGGFEEAVRGLDDPLNDPLPGQHPSPWFRAAGAEQEAEPAAQGSEPERVEPGPQRVEPEPEWYDPEGYAQDWYGGAPGAQQAPVRDDETVALRTADTRRIVEPRPPSQPQPQPQSQSQPQPRTHPRPPSRPDREPDRDRERETVPRPREEAGSEPEQEPESASESGSGTPATGGRAARRKAAKKGGGGRRRAGGMPEAAPAEDDGKPLTRVEARRAARAAKPTAGVLVSRGIGEVFISIGVLMLLFVTYQLWWSNIRAHNLAGNARHHLEDDWANGKGKPDTFEPGQGFAILYIPKLDVVVPIAEGISKTKVLDKGMVGHYGEDSIPTAMPDAKTGNFALAGHRNTHGEPFRYINQLKPGDPIVVETQDKYYVYKMANILPQTPPSNTAVINPVPVGSGFTTAGRYITLTTCTPEFTSTYRMIVWGKMVEERPRSKGKPDALVG